MSNKYKTNNLFIDFIKSCVLFQSKDTFNKLLGVYVWLSIAIIVLSIMSIY